MSSTEHIVLIKMAGVELLVVKFLKQNKQI